jgi:type I restriction enzyme S subunit
MFTTESSLDALKQTILQLAVMGKLVPQDPNDEPASELLKRIAKERARLEAEGVCKKMKAAPLSKDEQTFEVLEGLDARHAARSLSDRRRGNTKQRKIRLLGAAAFLGSAQKT